MRNLFIVFSLCYFFIAANGQERVTKSDGRVVLLSVDGTWSYEQEDSVINDYSCSELIKSKVDKMSGRTYFSMRDRVVCSKNKTNGLILGISKSSSGSIIFSLSPYGASSCIKESQDVNFLFEGDYRFTLQHDSDFNCKNSVVIYFGGIFGKKRELKVFKAKKIKTIRVWTSDGYVEEDLSEDQAMRIMKSFDCL